jgi:dTDP-4-dehydrorhamnose reductase
VKILLFGKNGQVGWELQRSLSPLGELIALGSDSADYCGDFNNLDGLAQTVRAVSPDVIVNAAAYTAVDKAETEQALARAVNALAPAVLAREATKIKACLIHYSTDYVFDGSGELPWKETDATGPLSVYGKTKLEGEIAIRESGCQHLIFRTSWVYAARGANFAKTMLRLAQERDELTIIDDQFGAPTGAELLADVTAHCLRQLSHSPELGGIYNLAASGTVTWYEYAKFVIEFARERGFKIKAAPEMIRPIPTSAYPTPAPRPGNSRLDLNKIQNAFDVVLPEWQIGMTRMLSELSESK